MERVLNGVITAIKASGYGFIRDEEQHSRFFHARDLVNARFHELVPNLVVEFEPLDGRPYGNGRRAERVRIIG
jgi:cold shock CspA family protein